MMHLLPALIDLATKPAPKASSSSSSLFLLVLVGGFALFYFLVMRPRTQRQRKAQQAKKEFALDDEVVSIGGIVGKVVGYDDEEVDVEVAPGTNLTFLKRAVNLRNPPEPQQPASPFSKRSRQAAGKDDKKPDDKKEEDSDDAEFGGSDAPNDRGDASGGASEVT